MSYFFHRANIYTVCCMRSSGRVLVEATMTCFLLLLQDIKVSVQIHFIQSPPTGLFIKHIEPKPRKTSQKNCSVGDESRLLVAPRETLWISTIELG